MINVHARSFTDFSHASKCNRHLIAVAISTLMMSGAAFAWISGRFNISKVCVKRIFYWSLSSFVVGLIQWNISLRNHSLATYTIPPSNSVPYRSRSKASQIFQDIASTLFVPWGLARLVHYCLGDTVNFSSRGKISQSLGQSPDRNEMAEMRMQLLVRWDLASILHGQELPVGI